MKIDVMQEAATILHSLGFLRVRKGSVYRLKGETIDIVVEVMRSRIYFFSSSEERGAATRQSHDAPVTF